MSRVSSFAALTRAASQATLKGMESATATLKRVLTNPTQFASNLNNPLSYWLTTHPEVKGGKVGPHLLSAKLPDFIGQTLLSLLVFIMGLTMKGDWVLFREYFRKYQLLNNENSSFVPMQMENYSERAEVETEEVAWNQQIIDFVELRFAGFWTMAIPAFVISYVFFFGIGGFLHFYYYVYQRNNPEDWKCQPSSWLPPQIEMHEIILGTFCLNIGSFMSAMIATWIKNDGWCTIYYSPLEYGYIWLLIQVPVVFIWQDYLTYWTHRILHWPWFYKKFHKLHHTYKQPTAFSVTALHPAEFLFIQGIYVSPMFLVPVHFFPYSLMLMYMYYHGIIDHSGITFKRHWWQPWQPDCIFHDNHHQYFHVNFAFNIEYWDVLHGTYRQKGRIYREDIFYGKGKALEEATADEIMDDMEERVSENPLAYQNNERAYDLTVQDLKKLE